MEPSPRSTRTIRIGYRRLPDGSAVPVCEPPIDGALLFLWQHVSVAIIHGDAYHITADLEGQTTFTGSMRPTDLAHALSLALTELVKTARETIRSVHALYPFDRQAKQIASLADVRLLMALDEPFVEVEPPRVVQGVTFRVEQPQIQSTHEGTRVIVTGYLPANPFAAWANEEIRDTMRERILTHIAETPVRGAGLA